MNRIQALRKSRKLSQKNLGSIVGVAQNTICNWENGNREPDYESLQKLAIYFDCSIDYLLGRDSGQKEKPTPDTGDGLSKEQAEIIRLYDSAPPALQAAALAVLRSGELQGKAPGESSKDQ